MATNRIGSALLLLLAAGCGGGGAATPPAQPPAGAAVEEEGGAGQAASSQAAAKPQPVKIDESMIPEPGTPLARENYVYAGGPRDPFASVLEGSAVGPELSDLDLVAIYYVARNPATSTAVLRDRITGKSYTVREDERLGLIRVSEIREKDVVFAINDYGTVRQVTLTLRKEEDNTP